MKILNRTSKTLQRYLLSPKSGDNYRCFFWTREGFRYVTIKVGRKWVSMSWTGARRRLSLAMFKNHAWLQWRYNARNERPNVWYRNYGFKTNPDHESVDKLAWKC
jgi:hypothetical protein